MGLAASSEIQKQLSEATAEEVQSAIGRLTAEQLQKLKTGIDSVEEVVTFEVTVTSLGGDEKVIAGNRPWDLLSELSGRVALELGVPRGALTLTSGNEVLSHSKLQQTLHELGIGPGHAFGFTQLFVLELEDGIKVNVVDAGTESVNGTYSVYPQLESVLARFGEKRGKFFLQKVDGPHTISWYGTDGKWPAGWYIETRKAGHGIYFLASDDNSCLPLVGWQVYNADAWASPGDLPPPDIAYAP